MALVYPHYDSLTIIYQIENREKIENIYSTWLDIMLGVPQGSILGSLLFNAFLADLFFVVNYIAVCQLCRWQVHGCR